MENEDNVEEEKKVDIKGLLNDFIEEEKPELSQEEAIKAYKEVNEEILLWNKNIVKNIIMSYLADMNKYTLNNSESVKIEKVYKAIPLYATFLIK